MSLERQRAIEIPFVVRDQLRAINLSVRGEEVIGPFTQLTNVICFRASRRNLFLMTRIELKGFNDDTHMFCSALTCILLKLMPTEEPRKDETQTMRHRHFVDGY